MAAHLPGMCAAISQCLLLEFQCIQHLLAEEILFTASFRCLKDPVATVAINGGANAGILAAKILATSDADLLQRLKDYKEELKDQVVAKDARLQEVGYKNY